ncbi:ThuA domain-containing protein [Fulvivirgaceae bacterium BMA10]|uniref:ThuA domain-containing protein n=1 Tax=Splendidivirga corallicola TaxID=3051826 RepID=A0ABT8KJM8_9BACT|nr:ThuA domain-containing protein [Fulvivirgaceae bacterium BMA10]
MKSLIYVFLCALMVACNGQKQQDTNDETTSTIQQPKQWLSFEGSESNSPHIVLISGDEEYRSEEALPQLAKILSSRHGFKCTVLFPQDPEKPGIVNPNYTKNIPGLENLSTADMMVIFTRFRALPDEQMQHIDDYLKLGKPVMGIRTATHAFKFDKADSVSAWRHYGNGYQGEKEAWKDGFGRLILGEKWISHHGHHKHQSTKGLIAPDAIGHAITNGIKDGDIWGSTDVYGVRLPLPGDSQPIILGQVINRKGEFVQDDIFYGMKPSDDEIATKNNRDLDVNNPMMPIAWIKSYQLEGGEQGKVLTTTIGASSDMLSEGVRRLLVNGVFWALDLQVPEKANVDIVGTFNPSQYQFQKNEYWSEKALKVSDFE